jgi:amino acid transporter
VGLVRALGLRDMTFNTVNVVVGASIFVLPAAVAGVLGPASVIAYLVCAIAMAFVALCFAEAGSRVASTGGLYAYAEAAFGPFAGYLAGVIMWFGSFMLGSAGIAVVLTGSIGALFPALAGRAWQVALLVALFTGLAIVNIRGTRIGARVVVSLTVLKIAPLLLLVAAGYFFIDPENLKWPEAPSAAMVADGALVLVFAFMGLEMAVTPGGEIRDPARTVPRAILSALALITLLYLAVQLVAQGVLGSGLAQNTTAPLAAVAEVSLGGGGRAIILIGTILSTFGYLAGDMLSSPRVLFAFGRDGHLPALFGRVHPRFHTPHVAIVVHAAAALGFALTGTFQSLVVLSVVSTLLIYLICAASVLVMRKRGIRTASPPFVAPGGPLVPIIASGVVIWLLTRATRSEFIAVGVMLVVAVVLYFARGLYARRAAARAA